MKIKLIAVAAMAVCGSSVFAATVECDALDHVKMATTCVPEVTVYMAGASAQKPAIDTLMLKSGSVLDSGRVIAYVTPSTNDHSYPTASYSKAEGQLGKSGIKNTVIYMGFGAPSTAYAGKRVAVVYNTANGSFAGVKQMTKAASTSTVFNETTSWITRLDATDATPALVCADGGTTAVPATNLQVMVSGKTAVKTGSGLVSSASTKAGTVICNIPAANYFDYTTTAAPGAVKGVQLALADVSPSHASPDVALEVGAPLKAADYAITATAIQGFGVIVNNKALQALAGAQVANGMLPHCSAADAAALTHANVTGACQPTITRALMSSILSGKATGSMVSGTTTDATKITLQRRNNWSGTQAASNLMFAGYGNMEANAKIKADLGKVTGAIDVWSTTGQSAPDLLGNVSKTVGEVTSYYNVGSGDVINGVADDTTTYSFGVVSLEKAQTFAGINNKALSDSGLKSSNSNYASWVKIDGISPNFTGLDQASDLKQRAGMAMGYPMQYEMVSIVNTKALKAKGTVVANQKAVVTDIAKAIGSSTYNLAGLSYFTLDAADTDTTRKAVFTRGGVANNFAPLAKQ